MSNLDSSVDENDYVWCEDELLALRMPELRRVARDQFGIEPPTRKAGIVNAILTAQTAAWVDHDAEDPDTWERQARAERARERLEQLVLVAALVAMVVAIVVVAISR
jgi:hypothetical protein